MLQILVVDFKALVHRVKMLNTCSKYLRYAVSLQQMLKCSDLPSFVHLYVGTLFRWV